MRRTLSILLLAMLAPGCGGATPQMSETTPVARPTAARASNGVGRHGPMAVSGLHGTLSPREVRGALEPRMAELTGCFALRSMSFEHLGGQLRMLIRVAGDGTVVAAHPENSTVGDRDVERCVRRIIHALRFPRTHGGGEAQIRWALSVEPPSSVRQALTWDPERVAHVIRRRGTRTLEQCNAASDVQVTAYVSRRGRVINVGAASSEGHDDAVLDCVARRVRAWRMPSTRHVTKVTFEITT